MLLAYQYLTNVVGVQVWFKQQSIFEVYIQPQYKVFEHYMFELLCLYITEYIHKLCAHIMCDNWVKYRCHLFANILDTVGNRHPNICGLAINIDHKYSKLVFTTTYWHSLLIFLNKFQIYFKEIQSKVLCQRATRISSNNFENNSNIHQDRVKYLRYKRQYKIQEKTK